MNVQRFLERLKNSADYKGQIVHVEVLPPRPARTRQPQAPIHPVVARALEKLGIDSLYTHQADAVDAVRRGEHVVVVTGTASGKTLCYTIPILEGLLEDPESTALLMFPTKALAQDQLRGLLRFKGSSPTFRCVAGTYDGDTPQNTRRTLRDGGNCILTNPDMLHSGILPRHTSWGRFFGNLRYVVMDELHTYRGIFGSHVANVCGAFPRRRPLRIVADRHRVFGHHRQPGGARRRLIGAACTVVDDDGSPPGKKHFVFWNPPRIGETMERRSANAEAREIMVELISERVQTIAFTRARVVAELLYRYVREDLQRRHPSLARAVRAYRGGYLPPRGGRSSGSCLKGSCLGIASTNALELGIDIGGLDAAILVGYPGSIASCGSKRAGPAGASRMRSLFSSATTRRSTST